MDRKIKERLIGLVVLLTLAVIFVPMFLGGPEESGERRRIPLATETGDDLPETRLDLNVDGPESPDPSESDARPPEGAETETAPDDGPVSVSGLEASDPEASGSQAGEAATDTGEESGADAPPTGGTDGPAEPEANNTAGSTEEDPADEPTPEPTPETEASGESETASPEAEAGDSADTADTETDMAPGGSGWAAQVGSFTHRDNADDLIRQLRDLGFEAFLMRHRTDGRVFYRVRVGLEPDRDAAVELAERIRRETGHEAAPVPHP